MPNAGSRVRPVVCTEHGATVSWTDGHDSGQRQKPLGPDGQPMRFGERYRARLLKGYQYERLRKGDSAQARMMPNGVVSLENADCEVFELHAVYGQHYDWGGA